MTDAKDRLRVVLLKRKLQEFVDVGGKLCAGTIAGSFTKETAGIKELRLCVNDVPNERKRNNGSLLGYQG